MQRKGSSTTRHSPEPASRPLRHVQRRLRTRSTSIVPSSPSTTIPPIVIIVLLLLAPLLAPRRRPSPPALPDRPKAVSKGLQPPNEVTCDEDSPSGDSRQVPNEGDLCGREELADEQLRPHRVAQWGREQRAKERNKNLLINFAVGLHIIIVKDRLEAENDGAEAHDARIGLQPRQQCPSNAVVGGGGSPKKLLKYWNAKQQQPAANKAVHEADPNDRRDQPQQHKLRAIDEFVVPSLVEPTHHVVVEMEVIRVEKVRHGQPLRHEAKVGEEILGAEAGPREAAPADSEDGRQRHEVEACVAAVEAARHREEAEVKRCAEGNDAEGHWGNVFETNAHNIRNEKHNAQITSAAAPSAAPKPAAAIVHAAGHVTPRVEHLWSGVMCTMWQI